MPTAAGIGLVALDVVIDERRGGQAGSWAGGSCGNVMSILAYLGWSARPISRLADSGASHRVLEDLHASNVDTRWLQLEPHAPAPVYIERLAYDDAGVAHHRFERFCPECGRRLPGYRAVTRAALEPVLDALDEHDVLYIDRPSPGAALAAERARARGVFVYFEPSARGDQDHLSRIALAANVVKYSADRLTAADRQVIAEASPNLEIETHGMHGLRYRSAGDTWRQLNAPEVPAKDPAGAGDWLSAGLLHELFVDGDALLHLSGEQLVVKLESAQALAAFSCSFVGARGAMDVHTAKDVLARAKSLAGGCHVVDALRAPDVVRAEYTCAGCG